MALVLDGVDQYAEIPFSWSNTSDFSIAIKHKATVYSNSAGLVSTINTAGPDDYVAGYFTGGTSQIGARERNADDATNYSVLGVDATDADWNSLVVTYTAATNTVTLYQDTLTGVSVVGETQINTGDALIAGALIDFNGEPFVNFQGKVAALRGWNRKLSAAEALNYNTAATVDDVNAISGGVGADLIETSGGATLYNTPTFDTDTPFTATPDTSPPTFISGPTVIATTKNGHTIASTLNEIGTKYGVRLQDGATAPTSAQVKAGHDGTGAAALESLSVATNEDFVFSTGTLGTAYDYYIVADDDESTPNLQANPTLVEATTSTTPTQIWWQPDPADLGFAPSGWTNRFGNSVLEVKQDVEGEYYLEVSAPADQTSLVTLDTVDGLDVSSLGDCQVFGRYYSTSIDTDTRLLLRWNPIDDQGHVAGKYRTDHSIIRVNGINGVGLASSNNDAWAGEFHNVRSQAIGGNYKTRNWLDNVTEPATWSEEVSDTSFPNQLGHTGFLRFRSETYRIYGIGIGLQGAPAPTGPADSPSNAPVIGGITSITRSTVSAPFTFDSGTNTGGTVDEYQVRVDGGEWVSIGNPDPKSFELQGLVTGTTYNTPGLEMRALTTGVGGPVSTPVTFSTKDLVVAPIGLSVNNINDTSALLDWSAG